jgi:hypothetical protein
MQRLLSPSGRFYLVAIQQNKPLAVIEAMKGLGMMGEVSFFSVQHKLD